MTPTTALPTRTEVAIVGAGPTGLDAGRDPGVRRHRLRPRWTGWPRAPTRPGPRWCTPAPWRCWTNSAPPRR